MPVDALPTPGVISRPVQRSVARAVILRGALPADVGTFTLTGGAFTDITGATALAGMKGTLQPVDGAGRAMSILHAASGKVIVPIAVPLEVQDDGTWSIGPLPYTDDPALAGPFRYRVSWNVSSSAPSPGNKIFEVPTGSGATVDFDLLGSATGTLVTPVAVPLVTSVAGETGVVTSADIAAGLDTDGTRLSAASLKAATDAEIAAQGLTPVTVTDNGTYATLTVG